MYFILFQLINIINLSSLSSIPTKKIYNINFIFYIRLKFISINFFFNKY